MSNIKNIVKAYTQGDKTQEDYFKERAKICGDCEFNTMNGAEITDFVRVRNRALSPNSETCQKCTCPLDKKLGVKEEECPIGKWSKVELTGSHGLIKGFKVAVVDPVNKLQYTDGVFYITVPDSDGTVFNSDFIITTPRKYSPPTIVPTCGCTTTIAEELDNNSYKITTRIVVHNKAPHKKTVMVSFIDGNRNKINVPIKVVFNKN